MLDLIRPLNPQWLSFSNENLFNLGLLLRNEHPAAPLLPYANMHKNSCDLTRPRAKFMTDLAIG